MITEKVAVVLDESSNSHLLVCAVNCSTDLHRELHIHSRQEGMQHLHAHTQSGPAVRPG